MINVWINVRGEWSSVYCFRINEMRHAIKVVKRLTSEGHDVRIRID